MDFGVCESPIILNPNNIKFPPQSQKLQTHYSDIRNCFVSVAVFSLEGITKNGIVFKWSVYKGVLIDRS